MRRRIERDCPEDFVEGWTFRFPLPAFIGVLDISRVERKETFRSKSGEKVRTTRWAWTQSDPPVYAFSTGDVFYAPNRVPEIWEAQLKWIRHSIQIESVDGDSLELAIIEYPSKTVRRMKVSQGQLAAILRSGNLSDL